MRKKISSLNYAMIARSLGFLLLIEAAFMLIPMVVAICNNEPGATRAFGISAALTLAVGALCTFCILPRRRDLGKYDSVLLTSLIWVVFSLFGLIPYMLAPSTHLSFSRAFFEAMSGFTTTGASLIEDTNQLSHAIHIWRCLSQWIGGLGIILFTLALLPMFNSSGGMQMFNAEQAKVSMGKVSPRVTTTARRLWLIYILLTLVLFGLLCLGPMSAFESACHALSAMSTGGFSTSSHGINSFASAYVKVILTIFMFIGGVNFALIYRASTGRPGALFRNETFLTFCKVILGMTVLFAILIYANGSYTGWESITIDPLFMVVSFITSTGYMLEAFNGWGISIMALALVLIFVGGCAGSTSGGAKIDRVVYLLKFIKNEIKRTLRPNAILPVRISDRTIPMEQVNKVVAFLALYLIITITAAIVLTIFGTPIEEAFVACLASMGNASLSIADSTMGCDYQALGTAAHYVLAFVMLTGRLEIFTIMVLFSRTFWRH